MFSCCSFALCSLSVSESASHSAFGDSVVPVIPCGGLVSPPPLRAKGLVIQVQIFLTGRSHVGVQGSRVLVLRLFVIGFGVHLCWWGT